MALSVGASGVGRWEKTSDDYSDEDNNNRGDGNYHYSDDNHNSRVWGGEKILVMITVMKIIIIGEMGSL